MGGVRMDSKGSTRDQSPSRGTHLGGSGRRGGGAHLLREDRWEAGTETRGSGGCSENDRLRRSPPSAPPPTTSADSGRESRQVGGAFKEGQELDRVQKHVSFSILPSWNP